ncbi:MAG: thiamine-binding protein [Pseudothermotoga sp.]|uniref:thiamine-binding protein n=1 Tax=Pseudothermotoga sp. TaxID=2033661 RepID=UPI0019B07292|nr:thiamine-binding protein [Pseudothermotoga sp.]
MKITCSIRLLPLKVEGKDQIYGLVDEAIGVIASSGLKYLVGPSETTVEGEFSQLLELIQEIYKKMTPLCDRYVLEVVFDCAKDGVNIDEKIAKYR